MSGKTSLMVQDWFDAVTRVGRVREELLRAEQHRREVESTIGRTLAPKLMPGDRVTLDVDLPEDSVTLIITGEEEGYTLTWGSARSGGSEVIVEGA